MLTILIIILLVLLLTGGGYGIRHRGRRGSYWVLEPAVSAGWPGHPNARAGSDARGETLKRNTRDDQHAHNNHAGAVAGVQLDRRRGLRRQAQRVDPVRQSQAGRRGSSPIDAADHVHARGVTGRCRRRGSR